VTTRETLYRSFRPEIEVRASGDRRTVHGIAVPYGVPVRIDSTLTEQFARGAFARQITAAHRVPFTRGHQTHGGEIIGRVTELRDDATGLYFEARVSPTQLGNDTLALLADGALDQVSIGFLTAQDRRLADGTVERVTATLRELSVVPEGAYGEHALAAGVRAQAGCTCGAEDRMAELRRILAGLPVLPLAS
jgi:HK97 family phage prohead protease